MPAFDEQATINIANEYLNHPSRYPSDHDLEARDVVTKTTILLAKIAHSLSANALRREAHFFLRLVTDPNTTKPAFIKKKSNEPTYGAVISLAFIESLFNRVVGMRDLASLDFDISVFVALAGVTAIGHEFSHGLYGHCEIDTDDERELYLQELDADRRSGCGSFVVRYDSDLVTMMENVFGISEKVELLKATMFSHSVLALALSGSSSAVYADYRLRCFLYFEGYRSIVLDTEFANFLEIEYPVITRRSWMHRRPGKGTSQPKLFRFFDEFLSYRGVDPDGYLLVPFVRGDTCGLGVHCGEEAQRTPGTVFVFAESGNQDEGLCL